MSTSPPITPVVLCGGSGTRLWPISRRSLPKQFSGLLPGQSMFQQTLNWVAPENGFSASLLLANLRHQDIIDQQTAALDDISFDVLYEPDGKNTASAVLSAALYLVAKNPDAILLSIPSDHILNDRKAFALAMRQAHAMASKNRLVLFGIPPNQPDSAYGYIVPSVRSARPTFRVRSFVEKPDTDRAEQLLEQSALWNSGMLMVKAKHLINLFSRLNPELLTLCEQAIQTGTPLPNGLQLGEKPYQKMSALSLDHALLEKVPSVWCVRASFRWSDVGSWNAIAQLYGTGKSENHEGNILKGDSLQVHCRNTYLQSDHRLVTAVGVENLVVVETADAVLVADRSKVGNVSQLVEQMKQANRDELVSPRNEKRPWGGFSSLDQGGMHQVKNIRVEPGGVLSLQRHSFRSEHWVVVEGIATVTLCGETRQLLPNESVYMPKGAVHRLANDEDRPLHLIEVQYGTYLGEDDIERFDDHYGRTTQAETQPSASPAWLQTV